MEVQNPEIVVQEKDEQKEEDKVEVVVEDVVAGEP